jgi:hypothetical protein
MEAALFTYRCFEKSEDQFPSSVGAFILHGQSEMLQAAATGRFDKLIAGHAKLPARIHKTGPLAIHPSIWTEAGSQEIDWTELSHRVEREIPVRPENEGVCVFSMPSTGNVASAPSFAMPPGIAEEVKREFQRALLSQTSQSADGRSFLFLGSTYRRDDCPERTGVVYVIEAPSLNHALAVCSGLVEGSWKTTILVEWCCSIYNVDSDARRFEF